MLVEVLKKENDKDFWYDKLIVYLFWLKVGEEIVVFLLVINLVVY